MTTFGNLGLLERILVWLVAGGLGIGALAFVPSPLSLFDVFQTVPDVEIRKAPALSLKTVPALESFDPIIARPLFNPGRVPDPETGPVAGTGTGPAGPVLGELSQYRVVGIAGDGVTNIALVQKSGGEMLRLRKGDSLDGWIVTEVGAKGVSIRGGTRKEVLTIPRARNREETP